jgi:rhodanese-related sulfurtransferase
MIRLFILMSIVFLGNRCQLSGQDGFQLQPASFEQKLQNEQVQLLDVRTADEFKLGYINGALQANWLTAKEFADRTQYLDQKKPVLVYCASGGRSAEAARQLRSKGYEVFELSGGFNKWKKEDKPVTATAKTDQLTIADFNTMIHLPIPVLVDFGAVWCPPCRKMEPVLDSLQNELGGKFKIIKIDGGIHSNLMKELKVETLPHFFVYKNGRQVWQKQGLVSSAELKKAIL